MTLPRPSHILIQNRIGETRKVNWTAVAVNWLACGMARALPPHPSWRHPIHSNFQPLPIFLPLLREIVCLALINKTMQ